MITYDKEEAKKELIPSFRIKIDSNFESPQIVKKNYSKNEKTPFSRISYIAGAAGMVGSAIVSLRKSGYGKKENKQIFDTWKKRIKFT